MSRYVATKKPCLFFAMQPLKLRYYRKHYEGSSCVTITSLRGGKSPLSHSECYHTPHPSLPPFKLASLLNIYLRKPKGEKVTGWEAK